MWRVAFGYWHYRKDGSRSFRTVFFDNMHSLKDVREHVRKVLPYDYSYTSMKDGITHNISLRALSFKIDGRNDTCTHEFIYGVVTGKCTEYIVD